MKNKIIFIIFFILLFSLINVVSAADVLTFDSTDNYLGGCQLTNKSEWELKENINVTKFQLWYQWEQGETILPVKVLQDGKIFAEFDATRAECDPYQKTWCNAGFNVNKLFPKGKYSTEITNKRQCLKPGGTGTVRLYKAEAVALTNIKPTSAIAQPTQLTPSCSCNQTTILVTAAITSLITSFLVSFLLRR